ncbi:hypothetical protein [Bacillus sp. SG-1]|uniref:hypothetical protein n=1 Tax=Bacillus sp. SG-1 TaxID=161544 RepID=UPI0001543DD7|nr:hypothetical protein [Bacillus sp. SG-1]EDL66195.1 hypothetical protein BSG1_02545 [Bacillus sp. SG-1]
MSKKNVDIEEEVKAAEEKPNHSVWDAFWRGAQKAEEEAVETEEKEEDEKPGFRWF